MWIQCCSAYHSCLKVQLPQYSGVWSFTYCKCYNVIIWEPVMHYTFFIKEHHHLKVKCGKSQRFKVYIDRNCFWDSWVWDENTPVILSISKSALHLPSEGGKYPNKQSRITFDWGLPCHYKTKLFSWLMASHRAQRPWRLFFPARVCYKNLLLHLISQESWYTTWGTSFTVFLKNNKKNPCQVYIWPTKSMALASVMTQWQEIISRLWLTKMKNWAK